jgi:MFS transporter, YNFM family, putative membrane transport protein
LIEQKVATPSVIPVVLSGFCAFLSLYAPQPILPMLAGIFHASNVMISLMITATTAGVALAAPLIGQLADRVGRKRVIVLSALTLGVTTMLTATSSGLGMLLFWRFMQGVATPGVFSVTTAYVHDEWPPRGAASAISAYVTGTIVGGFSGRAIVGFGAERWGWHLAFVLLGCICLAIAGYMAIFLPLESHFARPALPSRLIDSTTEHLRNPRLRAAYTIGFCVLFTQIAMFTYVTFHLAAPPFRLSPGVLGSIFVVYLAGATVTPLAGRRIEKSGHPRMLVFSAALAAAGALLTLGPRLWMVVAGLAVCCSGVFIAQASATSFVGTAAKHNRALALGLYVTFYYTGGSFGGVAPGWLWTTFGWAGCVALVVLVQVAIASVAHGMVVTRGGDSGSSIE